MHRKKIMRKQNKQICNKQIEKKIDFSNRQKFTQKKIHGGNFPGSNFPGEGNFPGRQFFEGGEGAEGNFPGDIFPRTLKTIIACDISTNEFYTPVAILLFRYLFKY